MAAPGGKTALSNRLASMGFMKRAGSKTVTSNTAAAPEQSKADVDRTQTHAAASTSQPSLRQQQHQSSKEASQTAAGAAADNQQPGKKYELSEKLTSMKFMQRGQQHKRGYDEAIGQQDTAKQEAEWVAAAADTSKGCVVIQERDPLPAGVCGRMSFGHFNPDTEQLQAQAEAIATGKPLPSEVSKKEEEGSSAGVSVTDDDMAAGWGRGRNVLSSLRMQRNQKRQRVH